MHASYRMQAAPHAWLLSVASPIGLNGFTPASKLICQRPAGWGVRWHNAACCFECVRLLRSMRMPLHSSFLFQPRYSAQAILLYRAQVLHV